MSYAAWKKSHYGTNNPCKIPDLFSHIAGWGETLFGQNHTHTQRIFWIELGVQSLAALAYNHPIRKSRLTEGSWTQPAASDS